MSKRKEMAALDFSKYKGKYVALINRRVVASGNNARTVWAKARLELFQKKIRGKLKNWREEDHMADELVMQLSKNNKSTR
jgi:hypothetical protein